MSQSALPREHQDGYGHDGKRGLHWDTAMSHWPLSHIASPMLVGGVLGGALHPAVCLLVVIALAALNELVEVVVGVAESSNDRVGDIVHAILGGSIGIAAAHAVSGLGAGRWRMLDAPQPWWRWLIALALVVGVVAGVTVMCNEGDVKYHSATSPVPAPGENYPSSPYAGWCVAFIAAFLAGMCVFCGLPMALGVVLAGCALVLALPILVPSDRVDRMAITTGAAGGLLGLFGLLAVGANADALRAWGASVAQS